MKSSSTFLTALLLSSSSLVVANGFLSVPFNKQPASASNPPAAGLVKRQVATTLTNAQVLYYINLTLGTPPQSFQLQLDTGSSDVWTESANSSFCKSNRQVCAETGTYDSTKSSTFKQVNNEFDITYGDGTGASGIYAQDTLGLGSLSVASMEFGIASSSSSETGVCGIGYGANEAATDVSTSLQYPTLVDHLVTNGVIATHSYSLYLDTVNAPTGQILFGGIDTAKFKGPLMSMPIDADSGENTVTEFYVTLTGMNLQNANGQQTKITMNNIPALLDCGTSYIYLPSAMVSQIVSNFPAQYNSQAGLYLLPDCSLENYNGSVNFQFSNLNINVPLSEFVVEATDEQGNPLTYKNGNTACILSVLENTGDETSAVLGDTFLRNAYVVYDLDNKQIAMAQANFNVTSSAVSSIPSGSTIPGATAVSSVSVSSVSASQTHPGFGGGPLTSSVAFSTSVSGTSTGLFGTATAAASSSAAATSSKAAGNVANGTPFPLSVLLTWVCALGFGMSLLLW